MPIADARSFLKRAMSDGAFRDALETAADAEAREALLLDEGLCFSAEEVEQAFHGLHADCQYEAQADALRQIHLWWQFLSQT